MLPRLARIILIAAALTVTGSAITCADAATRWEQTSQLSQRDAERLDDAGMELSVRDGVVTLTLLHPTQVRVLTILGQPVSQQSLPAGVHRLKISARGIYIIRIGSVTRRITI